MSDRSVYLHNFSTVNLQKNVFNEMNDSLNITKLVHIYNFPEKQTNGKFQNKEISEYSGRKNN